MIYDTKYVLDQVWINGKCKWIMVGELTTGRPKRQRLFSFKMLVSNKWLNNLDMIIYWDEE